RADCRVRLRPLWQRRAAPPPTSAHSAHARRGRGVQAEARRHPLLGKNLIADDFRGAAITVFFKNLTDAQYLDLGVDRRIMETLAAEAGPEALVYTGAAHVKQAAVDLMRRDIARFTPIALALMMRVLWLSFGTLRGVFLPVLAVAMALV